VNDLNRKRFAAYAIAALLTSMIMANGTFNHLSGLMPVAAHPNGIFTPAHLVSINSTVDSKHPMAKTDASSNVFIVWDDTPPFPGCGNIFGRMWNATANSWEDPLLLSTESTDGGYEPSIAIDSDGKVHLVWQDYTDIAGAGTDCDILYRIWDPKTGLGSVDLVSTTSTMDSKWPQVAIDNQGNVHIVWCDLTDYDGSGTDIDIFYRCWIEWAHVWSDVIVVSTNSTEDSEIPDIAIDGSDNLHTTWTDATNLMCGIDTDIFYKNMSTSGVWSSTFVISDQSTEDCYDACISADNMDNVYVAWWDDTDYEGYTECIFFRMYDAATQSWGSYEVVSTESTASCGLPSMDFDSGGNIHVIWVDGTNYDGCGTDCDIFYKLRRYTTGKWSTTYVVSTDATDDSFSPSVEIYNRTVYATWEDKTNMSGAGYDWDIFGAKYELAGDINGDWGVDHKDLLLLAAAYGSSIGQPNYNPNADLDPNGKIDHKDLLILAANYGKTI
jgi:hypothetical protein